MGDGADLAGCGALKELDPARGEVKSMRTAPVYLRRGVAAAVLDEIVAAARSRGYDELLLEGGPFADYSDDPFSRFFSLVL